MAHWDKATRGFTNENPGNIKHQSAGTLWNMYYKSLFIILEKNGTAELLVMGLVSQCEITWNLLLKFRFLSGSSSVTSKLASWHSWLPSEIKCSTHGIFN